MALSYSNGRFTRYCGVTVGLHAFLKTAICQGTGVDGAVAHHVAQKNTRLGYLRGLILFASLLHGISLAAHYPCIGLYDNLGKLARWWGVMIGVPLDFIAELVSDHFHPRKRTAGERLRWTASQLLEHVMCFLVGLFLTGFFLYLSEDIHRRNGFLAGSFENVLDAYGGVGVYTPSYQPPSDLD